MASGEKRVKNTSLALSRKQRMGIYSAAAGALAATGAHAAPTPSPNAPTSFFVPDDGFEEVPFDIDGDGTVDFDFQVGPSDSCSSGQPGSFNFDGFGSSTLFATLGDSDQEQYYAALVSGAIPGSLIFGGDFAFLMGCDDSFGAPELAQLPDGGTGTVAVEFERFGETHYGWVTVEIVPGSITTNVLAACFESVPGRSIQAGRCATASIPVNGVVIPLSLGLLTVGALALRRRRQVV